MLIFSFLENKSNEEKLEKYFKENPIVNMNEAETIQYYMDKIKNKKENDNSKGKINNQSGSQTHAQNF